MESIAISICPKCNIDLAFDADEDNWWCPNCLENYTLIDEEKAPKEGGD